MTDFIKSVMDFIVIAVVLKIIVAHWLAERILGYSKRVFESSERNFAIWLHYQARATGVGHIAESVLGCAEGKCAIFHP
jgi:hypothetical protein